MKRRKDIFDWINISLKEYERYISCINIFLKDTFVEINIHIFL